VGFEPTRGLFLRQLRMPVPPRAWLIRLKLDRGDLNVTGPEYRDKASHILNNPPASLIEPIRRPPAERDRQGRPPGEFDVLPRPAWNFAPCPSKLQGRGGLEDFGTTSVQLSERKNSFLVPKRHQMKHLEFLILLFGTRGSEVQILSPRPIHCIAINSLKAQFANSSRLGQSSKILWAN
jgi:hypothetical protein